MQVNSLSDVGLTVAATGLQSWPIAALGTNTDLAEVAIGMQGLANAIAVGSVFIAPTAALTSNDSSFYTITLSKRTAGGSPTTIASATTKTSGGGGTGNWTAFTPVALTVPAGAFVSARDVLTLSILHTGTPGAGGAIPASQLELFTSAN